jgi:hypothetical protein
LPSLALTVATALVFFASVSPCQQTPSSDVQPPAVVNAVPNAAPHVDKHILGIVPNFRTSPMFTTYEPLKPREKFKIASQDSFDRGTFLLAAAFAGESQLNNDNRSFGQGVEGYSKYLGAAYADFAIGNYMTEAIFPTLLHQDPRYFRKGTGSGWSRLGYSVGQIFWTHQDSGHTNFNYSEIFGNSAGVAISNIYYKDSRTAHDAVSSLAVQVGVDLAVNIMKEFWPDFDNRFRHKHVSDADAAASQKH